jgi:uncharacterized phage-associated protein
MFKKNSNMAEIHTVSALKVDDVATVFLRKLNLAHPQINFSGSPFQELLYLAQIRSYIMTNEPLFQEKFFARIYGLQIRGLSGSYKCVVLDDKIGKRKYASFVSQIGKEKIESIDFIVKKYGELELSYIKGLVEMKGTPFAKRVNDLSCMIHDSDFREFAEYLKNRSIE